MEDDVCQVFLEVSPARPAISTSISFIKAKQLDEPANNYFYRVCRSVTRAKQQGTNAFSDVQCHPDRLDEEDQTWISNRG